MKPPSIFYTQKQASMYCKATDPTLVYHTYRQPIIYNDSIDHHFGSPKAKWKTPALKKPPSIP